MSTEKLIGHCGVDSGQIMIVDPCYIIDNKFSKEQYDECCLATLSDDQAGSVMRNLAVVSTTGIGDGYYPVYATRDNIDGWGERITEIRIDFTDHVLLNDEDEQEYENQEDES